MCEAMFLEDDENIALVPLLRSAVTYADDNRDKYDVLEIVTYNTHPQKSLGIAAQKFCREIARYLQPQTAIHFAFLACAYEKVYADVTAQIVPLHCMEKEIRLVENFELPAIHENDTALKKFLCNMIDNQNCHNAIKGIDDLWLSERMIKKFGLYL